jgi:AcrR family transcriptional regulator
VKTTVDPRQARSRKAMLDAARELLAREGPAAVTHQRVARQAGVGRATVYRHWPRPEQLMLDTMAGVELPFFRDPVTPVRPWLWGQLRTFADEIALPRGRWRRAGHDEQFRQQPGGRGTRPVLRHG